MNRKIYIGLIAFAFLFLFGYAAVIKLLDHEKFIIDISKSPLLTAYAKAIAYAVPFTELICCLLLILPHTRLIGLYLAFTLMTLFTAYIIAILQFSFFIPCSCGGVLQGMGWNEHLAFNIGFMALGIIAIVLDTKTGREERSDSPGLNSTI
jgi:hypothetical protein